MILNGVKSLSYAANMQATRLAKGAGADEAVLVQPDGTVLEPPTSAIFWVSPPGRRCAPRRSSDGVLESITRDRLIKALDVDEGAWPVEDLRAASEAFLASTTREIQAVAAIDGTALPAAPGPRTREAQAGIRRRPSAESCENCDDELRESFDPYASQRTTALEKAGVRWTSS